MSGSILGTSGARIGSSEDPAAFGGGGVRTSSASEYSLSEGMIVTAVLALPLPLPLLLPLLLPLFG